MRVGVLVLFLLFVVTVPESLCLGPGIGLGGDFPGIGVGIEDDDGFPDLPGFGDDGVGLPNVGGGVLLSLGGGSGFRGALRGTVSNPSTATTAPASTETSSTPSANPSTSTQETTAGTSSPPPAAAAGGGSSTPTCSATQTLLVGVCVECSSRIPGCTTCSTDASNAVSCSACLTGLMPDGTNQNCVNNPDTCPTAISGCEICAFQNPNVVCTMCDSGFALDAQANPATFCIPCSVIDNCATCSDTPETAEPPNFGIDDVECDTCKSGFDLQGGACVPPSDG